MIIKLAGVYHPRNGQDPDLRCSIVLNYSVGGLSEVLIVSGHSCGDDLNFARYESDVNLNREG